MKTAEQTRADLQAEMVLYRADWQQQHGRRSEDAMDAATVLALRRRVLDILEREPKPERVVETRPVPRFGASWPWCQIASYPIGFDPNPGLWS